MSLLDTAVSAIRTRVGDISQRCTAVETQRSELDKYLKKARRSLLDIARQRWVEQAFSFFSFHSILFSFCLPLRLCWSHYIMLSCLSPLNTCTPFSSPPYFPIFLSTPIPRVAHNLSSDVLVKHKQAALLALSTSTSSFHKQIVSIEEVGGKKKKRTGTFLFLIFLIIYF